MALSSESRTALVDPSQHFATDEKMLAPQPNLSLQVDFEWSKFRNTISEKNGQQLHPLFIQHFRKSKLHLNFESVADGSEIATSVMHTFNIHAECMIRGQEIKIQPLSRLKTRYNYLSHTLSPSAEPVPITWVTETSKKIWDFVCLDANQLPLAKFSVNIWALKEVGNFHFEKPKDEISDAVRDEIIIAGMTIFYVMVVRMNNPLNLLGAAFAKTGKVEGSQRGTELDNLPKDSGVKASSVNI